MNQESNNSSKTNAEFSGFLMVVLLFKHKWYILLATILTAVAAIFYSISLPNWYSASINVVPPKSAGNMMDQAMSGLSSALKEVGLSKLSGGKSGDQYSFLVILSSRTLSDSIINKYNLKKSYNSNADLRNVKDSDVRSQFKENLDVSLEADGNYVITILDKDSSRVASMVNDYVHYANELAKSIYHSETKFNREYMEKRIANLDSTLESLSKEISTYSQQTGIISPEDQGKAYVTAISDIKSEVMKNEIYLDYFKQKFGERDQMTLAQSELVNSFKSKLSQAENKPGLVGNFSKNDATAKGMNFLKMYAQYEALSKLKIYMMPMYEEAKINENRDIITLSVVDPAISPDKKTKPKRSLMVAGATLGGTFTSILLILAIYGIGVFRKKYKNALSELR